MKTKQWATRVREFLEGCILADPIIKYTKSRWEDVTSLLESDWAGDFDMVELPTQFVSLAINVSKPTNYTHDTSIITLPKVPTRAVYFRTADGYAGSISTSGVVSLESDITATVKFRLTVGFYKGI